MTDDTECSRILLAEDDDDLRELLALVLRQDGYEVLEAPSGTQLFERIAVVPSRRDSMATEIVITDLRMPGLSGIDVLAGVRALPSRRPVVLITAFGDDALHQRALQLGAAAVFDKPFDIDDLRLAVINLDRSRRAVSIGRVTLDDSRRPRRCE